MRGATAGMKDSSMVDIIQFMEIGRVFLCRVSQICEQEQHLVLSVSDDSEPGGVEREMLLCF